MTDNVTPMMVDHDHTPTALIGIPLPTPIDVVTSALSGLLDLYSPKKLMAYLEVDANEDAEHTLWIGLDPDYRE